MTPESDQRVAILFWDWGIGGVQTRFNDVIGELAERRSVSKISLFLRNDLRLRQLPRSAKFQVHFFSKANNLRLRQSFFWWLLKMLIKEQPTHVVAISNRFSLVAVLFKGIAWLRRLPCYVTINEPTFTTLYLKQYESSYWRLIVLLSYRFADTIIVPTQVMKDDLVSNFHIPDSKVVVIPSWVTFASLKKSTTRGKVGSKEYDLLFVGRLASEKRVDTFIDIFRQAQKQKYDLKGCIAGDGPLRGQIAAQLKRFRLNKAIKLVGFSSQVSSLLDKSKMLVLPSENEGLPMVVLEAYSRAVPAVIASFPGADEVVADGYSGLVVTERSTFWDLIKPLLEQPKQLKNLAENALEFGKTRFSRQNLTRFTNQVLGE